MDKKATIFYDNLVASASKTDAIVNSWEIFFIVSNTFGEEYSVSDTKKLIRQLVKMNLVETFNDSGGREPSVNGVKILTPVEIAKKKLV